MWRFHSPLKNTFYKSNFPTHWHLSRLKIFASHRSCLINILANSHHCRNTRRRLVFLFLNCTESYFIFVFRRHSKSRSHGKGETGSMKKVTKSDIGGETVTRKVMSFTHSIYFCVQFSCNSMCPVPVFDGVLFVYFIEPLIYSRYEYTSIYKFIILINKQLKL